MLVRRCGRCSERLIIDDAAGTAVEHRFISEGIELDGELNAPRHTGATSPALVLCHGYPDPTIGSPAVGMDLSELGARIATTMGWYVFTFRFRGCGRSGGNFSLGGWRDDILAAVDHLSSSIDHRTLWLAGFGTGGGLCISAAARITERLDGVAAMGAPAGFDDWASHTRRLLQHSRNLGVIRDADFPVAGDGWAEQFRSIRPVDDAAKLASIPMLLIHGADDESVPVFDSRVLADAHGSAELRVISGAGHGLRYDPRVVAILLGWLDRTRNRVLRGADASGVDAGSVTGDDADAGSGPSAYPAPPSV
ncbi:MAG: prolyl oligopeptidase family serine peptidase [Actinobacteria bacterium]|nr:prolyl oligopeptidase family serine peptidase [Actinomycetota bacterium]